MPTTLSQAPESYLKMLKHSLQIYRSIFKHVFFLALLISLIIFVPRLLSILVIKSDIFYDTSFFNIQRLWLIFIYLMVIFFFTALLWRIQCYRTGKHEKIVEDVEMSLKKIPRVIVAVILQSVILFFISAALIILVLALNKLFFNHDTPLLLNNINIILGAMSLQTLIGIYIFFLFLFYLPIIVVENSGVFAAIKKSVYLVWGYWWMTFWVQITPILVYLLILFIFKYILSLNVHIYFLTDNPSMSLLITVLQIIVFALFIPWMAVLLLTQLRDLEIRKKIVQVE